MTKVKICGITNLEDALHAVASGADMLGFNFYKKSSRYLKPEAAAEIISKLPDEVVKIGVFVNEPAKTVRSIANSAGLDVIQLHGDETVDYVEGLRGLDIIKAFRVTSGFNGNEVTRFRVDSILVDAFCPDEFGGTGRTCDWDTVSKLAKRFPRMYLSGGLAPDNVGDAIRVVRPFAVDACSRLEESPGRKDHRKMEEFINSVRSAE